MQSDNETNNGWFAEHREEFDIAIRASVAEALSELKRLGIPAATWVDGRVVLIPPEEIVVDEEALRNYVKMKKFAI